MNTGPAVTARPHANSVAKGLVLVWYCYGNTVRTGGCRFWCRLLYRALSFNVVRLDQRPSSLRPKSLTGSDISKLYFKQRVIAWVLDLLRVSLFSWNHWRAMASSSLTAHCASLGLLWTSNRVVSLANYTSLSTTFKSFIDAIIAEVIAQTLDGHHTPMGNGWLKINIHRQWTKRSSVLRRTMSGLNHKQGVHSCCL